MTGDTWCTRCGYMTTGMSICTKCGKPIKIYTDPPEPDSCYNCVHHAVCKFQHEVPQFFPMVDFDSGNCKKMFGDVKQTYAAACSEYKRKEPTK